MKRRKHSTRGRCLTIVFSSLILLRFRCSSLSFPLPAVKPSLTSAYRNTHTYTYTWYTGIGANHHQQHFLPSSTSCCAAPVSLFSFHFSPHLPAVAHLRPLVPLTHAVISVWAGCVCISLCCYPGNKDCCIGHTLQAFNSLHESRKKQLR